MRAQKRKRHYNYYVTAQNRHGEWYTVNFYNTFVEAERVFLDKRKFANGVRLIDCATDRVLKEYLNI